MTLRNWRYSGSGAVMMSELVAGSAWMKPPVDGPAEADTGAVDGVAPPAASTARWGCVWVTALVPPPARTHRGARREGCTQHRRQLHRVGVLQVHHPDVAGGAAALGGLVELGR